MFRNIFAAYQLDGMAGKGMSGKEALYHITLAYALCKSVI